jgi:hypothetical protein
MRPSKYHAIALLLIAMTAQRLPAKDKQKKTKTVDQDQISVAAHIAVTGAPILRFMATNHYGRSYVYAERGPGQPITLLDITNPGQPTVVSQLESGQLPSDPASAMNLVAVAGTAAISTSASSDVAKASAQTIRLLDFSDPANPKVTRQFEAVTAVERMSSTVTLLANSEGIWVLTNHLAENPADLERYARKVIYGDSMY